MLLVLIALVRPSSQCLTSWMVRCTTYGWSSQTQQGHPCRAGTSAGEGNNSNVNGLADPNAPTWKQTADRLAC
jgi:hypothetical protein